MPRARLLLIPALALAAGALTAPTAAAATDLTGVQADHTLSTSSTGCGLPVDGTRPADRDLRVTPGDRDLLVAPADRDLLITPADRDLRALPTDRDLRVVPQDRDLRIAPTDRDLLITPADRDLRVAPADRDLGVASRDGSLWTVPADRDLLVTPTDRDLRLTPADRDLRIVPADRDLLITTDRDLRITPADRDLLIRPTDRDLRIVPADRDLLIVRADRDLLVAPADRDLLIRPTDRDLRVVPTDRDLLIVRADRDLLVAPTDRDLLIRPTDRDLRITPTDRDLRIAPADRDLRIAPADRDLRVVPADRDLLIRPADRDLRITPTDRDLRVAPADRDLLVAPGDRDLGLVLGCTKPGDRDLGIGLTGPGVPGDRDLGADGARPADRDLLRDGSPVGRGGARVPVRFATFNASLNRGAEGQLVADLATPGNAQAREVAEVIQRNRPDVLLVNEFDYDADGTAADLFRENYLERGQNGARPIDYPYAFVAPANTGVQTGFDLNRDGRVGTGDDAHGFGLFEGQYGMLVLSKFPIDTAGARTFQNFRWVDMPGAMLPDDPATPAAADWYSPEILDVLRLSSKSHWDVPIQVGRERVHFLVSHPTPPTFDGPEDRNGTRNHDEIRFWADYVTPGKGRYIYDDQGRQGGLPAGDRFVVAGDNNSDPLDGDSVPGAINQLLDAPRVLDTWPGSLGGYLAAHEQGGANAGHRTSPFFDTADFNDQAPGNLRVDYVLPSRGLLPISGEVFWPASGSPLARLNDASDHHLVRVDVIVPRR